VRRPLCGSPTRSAEQTVYKQSRDLHTAVAGACGNNDDADDDDNDDDDDVTAFTRSIVIIGNVRCSEKYLINSTQFKCSLDKSIANLPFIRLSTHFCRTMLCAARTIHKGVARGNCKTMKTVPSPPLPFLFLHFPPLPLEVGALEVGSL